MRRLISAAGFRLKGSGWYETDFKTGDKRNLHGDSGLKSGSSKKDTKSDKKESKAKSAEA